MSFKHLFSKALSASPERLHFAAHSHHLWPDASFDGHKEAWDDAAKLADHKWDKIFADVMPEAQDHVARELSLPDPKTIAFSSNTHDFLVRLISALPTQKPRLLATTGEFHSFRRQALRWSEAGRIDLTLAQNDSIGQLAASSEYDLIFASQVLFNQGAATPGIFDLAKQARPDGSWVVIDGYHGFMATRTDLSQVADRVFYLAGGYKYAMAGEGVCFLHAPPGFGLRPEVTGWFAAFDDLAAAQGGVGYAPDGRRFLGSTFDPAGLYRFNAVQRMLLAEGLDTEAISHYCSGLKARFAKRARIAGFRLLSGPEARFLAYAGNAEGDAQRLHDALAARGVVTDVRDEVLRIGFALYHDDGDIDRLLEVVQDIRREG